MSKDDSTSDPRPTLIYCLKDPDTNEIRYIGKTHASLSTRLASHIYTARHDLKSGHSINWIKALIRKGTRPMIELIEIVPHTDDWIAREKYWIDYGRQSGWNLTNLTDGGEGTLGYNPPASVRRKYSLRSSGERNANARLNESQVVAIRDEYSGGNVTTYDLAAKYGVTPTQIQYILTGKVWRNAGGIIRVVRDNIGEHHARAQLTDAIVGQIRQMYADGVGRKDIAAQLGVSYRQVSNALNSNNWQHLNIAVTAQRQNMAGENNPRAKLTMAQAREIRALYASGQYTYRQLAVLYGTSHSAIGGIIKRRIWVDDE